MELTYKDFCNEIKKGRLLGLKCEGCGKVIFPVKSFCPDCGGNKLKKIELSKRGKIKTYTVIRVAPEGFNPPYIVAIVELPEDVLVMGNLDFDPEKAGLFLLGKEVEIGYKEVPGDKYSGGGGIALLFSLVE
ncbi:MAG: Zn-ribbon domain-containing OB-fold protein [Candidatus Desulfofervidus auxilii]|nr:Zn-ribbon domain-containing OB-fold protein [Candidatus Desulfofervidus auxilii]